MKKVIIQTNEFKAEQRPTTQEDNFGQIYDKYELFFLGESVGNLIKYYDNSYSVFHRLNGCFVRYSLKDEDVIFIK